MCYPSTPRPYSQPLNSPTTTPPPATRSPSGRRSKQPNCLPTLYNPITLHLCHSIYKTLLSTPTNFALKCRATTNRPQPSPLLTTTATTATTPTTTPPSPPPFPSQTRTCGQILEALNTSPPTILNLWDALIETDYHFNIETEYPSLCSYGIVP